MNKPTFISVNEHDLNEMVKNGYELVNIFYESNVVLTSVQKEVPGISTSSTYNAPTYTYCTETVPLMQSVPRFLMKLTKEAEVLFGDK
jgi:hypothetical protein